jgi:hypothetical protein
MSEGTYFGGGTRYHSLLRHYAISREVAGSILGEVIRFFNWFNSSSRTMALGWTQALTEITTRILAGGGQRAVGA